MMFMLYGVNKYTEGMGSSTVVLQKRGHNRTQVSELSI
jgi:hypothetical protein